MRFNEKIWFGFFTNKKNMQIDFLIIRIEHNFLTQFSMHSVERRDKKWWLKKIYDVYYLIVKCVIFLVHSWLRWNQPHPIIPPIITLARDSNKTKKYLGTYGRVRGKKFLSKICLFVCLLIDQTVSEKNFFLDQNCISWNLLVFAFTFWPISKQTADVKKMMKI